MHGKAEAGAEKETGLADLLVLFRQQWVALAALVVSSSIVVFGMSFAFTEVYRASVLVRPVSPEDESLNAMSGLASIAAMTGLSLTNKASDTDEYLARLTSREFLFAFFQEHELLPILNEDDWDPVQKTWRDPVDPPTLLSTYDEFVDDVLSVDEDISTGLVTVYVTWKRPEQAAQWANLLVSDANKKIQSDTLKRSEANLQYLEKVAQRTTLQPIREALYGVIEAEIKKSMLANASSEYAFRVIDRATVPERRSFPNRVFFAAIGAIGGFLLWIVYVAGRSVVRIGQPTV